MLMQQIEIRRLLSRSYTQTLFRTALVVLIPMGLSSPSKAQDSNSPIQLTITDALLSAHCVPASDNSQGLAFQSDSINRTLTIDGLNFLNGATPIVTLRGTGAQGGVVLPVSISIPTTPPRLRSTLLAVHSALARTF